MSGLKKYYFGKQKSRSLIDQIVAYYGLNGDAVDSIGLNSGTLVGAGAFASGKIGTSPNGWSTSQYITIPQSTAFDFSDASTDLKFSISFWWQKNDTVTRNFINKRGGTAGTDQWSITMTNGVIEIALFSNSVSGYISKKTVPGSGNIAAIVNNTWYHNVITYDGSGTVGGLRIYQNGSLATVTTDTLVGTYTKMPQASQITRIGRLYTGTNSSIFRMDEIGFWKNRMLNQAEVRKLYNSGNGLAYPF
ncbi:concanavalin A-like lectin/glucanase superfamily protein [Flavobacterium chryseum]|uniref:LamG-like jellyroll fold domain-containing protein n=1 Tax=Flavobacterium sp. P3160 TaxID=2512113 RepID=UPI00105E7967|nr:LamG-like jellyroll fold domain-containing protein [Flavobacterium sp. P3160]TDO68821.1 concanavalin A-like lectin/glucanase superfamily protein [Flavobacterium sp. P3160]